MDINKQSQIPPPIQTDGLRRMARAEIAAQPKQDDFAPHFDRSFFSKPTQRARKYVQKAHRGLSPIVMLIGYVTSAAVGLGLGYLILERCGFTWNF